MMRATEELKPAMVSLEAKELGMDGISHVIMENGPGPVRTDRCATV